MGRPPAKEITPGSEAAFKIALTNEGGVAFIPSDNRFSTLIVVYLALSEILLLTLEVNSNLEFPMGKMYFIVSLCPKENNVNIVWQTIRIIAGNNTDKKERGRYAGKFF